MSATSPDGRPRYLGLPALRHLTVGPLAPRRATDEALDCRFGEPARLFMICVSAVAVALADPTLREIGPDLAALVAEQGWVYAGIGLAAVAGLILVLVALFYLVLAVLLGASAGQAVRDRTTFARLRSVVVLGNWFALVPTVVATIVAAHFLPSRLVRAEQFNPLSIILAVVAAAYMTFCLAQAFGMRTGRAAFAAIATNLAGFLLIEAAIAVVAVATPAE